MSTAFEENSSSYFRDGVAKERGLRNQCRKKLVLFSSHLDQLLTNLEQDSRSNDCYEVKIFKESREGVYCGICYFTNEDSLGDAWARYESSTQIWPNIHDDEMSDAFKDRVRSKS